MDSCGTDAPCAFLASIRLAPSSPGENRSRRRRISSEAGHALEILGHAIEYLADEFVHQSGELSARDGQIEAVQLLMAVNRKIYFACPEVPTIGERFWALLGWRTA